MKGSVVRRFAAAIFAVLLSTAPLLVGLRALAAEPASGGPPFAISRETTHITEPLTPDGWPDYAAAILAEQRAGVTPENNGAVLFWQALGPCESEPEEFAAVLKELGVAHSDPTVVLTHPHSEATRSAVAEWLAGRDGAETVASVDAESQLVGDIISQAQDRPWTSDDCPPLAAWVAANEIPLDLLVEAAAKPQWYDPSPSLLREPNGLVFAALLKGVQHMRTASRGLLGRTMFRLGNGDHAAAWRDCRAVWQLGNHALSHDSWFVEELVGIAMHGVAHKATVAILSDPALPESVAVEILADLSAGIGQGKMAAIFDTGERWACLDALSLYYESPYPLHEIGCGEETTLEDYFSPELCSSTAALTMVNQTWDDAVAVLRVENRRDRISAADEFVERIDQRGQLYPVRAVLSLISGTVRGQLLGEIFAAHFVPPLRASIEADDRHHMSVDLTRVSAALAVYRAHHGEYPEDLNALVPEILSNVPLDLYSEQPLVYRRQPDGYLLYSVFQNGVNDGGTHYDGLIVNGQWSDEDEAAWDIDYKNSDLVIRVPVPGLVVPASDDAD